MSSNANYTRSARDELKDLNAQKKAMNEKLKVAREAAKKEREEGTSKADTLLRLLLLWLKDLGRTGDAVLAIKTSLTEEELGAFKNWLIVRKANQVAAKKAKDDAERGAEAEAVKKG